MFYYLYEIKNLINGKIYVGVHKTSNMDDGYMGSGIAIRNAIFKYGAGNFSKTILESFENSGDMFHREKEIVTEEFLARADTYNLRRGGTGGFDYINTHIAPELRATISSLGVAAKKAITLEERQRWKKTGTVDGNSAQQLAQYKNGRTSGFLNKTHTESAKQAIQIANRINSSGAKNSQFGSKWITNGIENRKLPVNIPLPAQWDYGRTLRSAINT